MIYLYPDQKDISNLAKGTIDSTTVALLFDLIRKREVTLVVSVMHALETARHSNPGKRTTIARYVDSLDSKVWIWRPLEIMKEEITKCFFEYVEQKDKGEFSPFDATPSSRSGLDDAQVRPCHEFEDYVDMLVKEETLKERSENWPIIRQLWRLSGEGQPIPDKVNREFLVEFVPEYTPGGLYVPRETRREFAMRSDLTACRSTQLFFEVDDKINSTPGMSVAPSELIDEFHIRAIPYCQMTTLDRRMYGLVGQTTAGKQYADRLAPNLTEALRVLGFTQ